MKKHKYFLKHLFNLSEIVLEIHYKTFRRSLWNKEISYTM